MNRVDLVGRLTANPELRYTTSNKAYTRFTIAVNRNKKNESGNYDADFISCIGWESKAELICNYFEKGNRIGISGKIQTGSYDKSDGSKGYTTDVLINEIDFIDTKEKTQSENINSEIIEENDPFKDFGEELTLTDDDLPF